MSNTSYILTNLTVIWWNTQGDVGFYTGASLQKCTLNSCEHTSKNRLHYPQPQYYTYNCLVILTKIMVSCQKIVASLKAGGSKVFSAFLLPASNTIPEIRENHIIEWINSWIIQIASHALCAFPKCGGNINIFSYFWGFGFSFLIKPELKYFWKKTKYLETSLLNLSFVHSNNKYLPKIYNVSSMALSAKSWTKQSPALLKPPVEAWR